MKSNIIKLSSRVRIRKEYFGGILFNMDTGDIIEVDREAFTVISIIKDIEVVDMKTLLALPISYEWRRIDRERIEGFLSKLATMGFISIMPAGVLSDDFNEKVPAEKSQIRIRWPKYEHLSAPETVHWALTYKCDKFCPDCYVARYKRLFTNELGTQEALKLIDKIADRGVFQLAIGGGEPFFRNDLEEIVKNAWGKGLIVHITTGKYEIEGRRLANLSKHVKTLQIGVRTNEILHKDIDAADKIKALVTRLNEQNIITGANLIMTKHSIYNLDRIMEILISGGFKRYTLLRYKPPVNVKRWLQEKPDKPDLYLLEKKLTMMQEKYPDIVFRIDCALSFLERRLNPQTALSSGIRGCVAFDRIMSIAPDGSVYPCSQLVGDKFKAGNLLDEDFASIWDQSKIAKRYRNFRNYQSFKNGRCGKCQAKAFCGGCRVFAEDAVGADPGCPEPLYSNKEEIEKWSEEGNDKDYPSWINI